MDEQAIRRSPPPEQGEDPMSALQGAEGIEPGLSKLDELLNILRRLLGQDGLTESLGEPAPTLDLPRKRSGPGRMPTGPDVI